MTTTETAATVEQHAPRHPAKFSKPIVEEIATILDTYAPGWGLRIIDPFAGVGGVHVLAEHGHDTLGVELQPEWAAQHERNVVGDSTDLSRFADGSFDAMVTSCCYGNRMADSHSAKDPCKTCGGRGCQEGCGTCQHAYDGPHSHKVCRACKGSGLSKRNTYTHALREVGVEPVDSPNNASKMQWGPAYRRVHSLVWDEMIRVVDGLLVLNVSNHLRGDVEQNVVEWHVYQFIARRCTLVEARRVATRRNGFGANRELRVDGEMILVFRTPDSTDA